MIRDVIDQREGNIKKDHHNNSTIIQGEIPDFSVKTYSNSYMT